MSLGLRVSRVRDVQRVDDRLVGDHIGADAGTRAGECEDETSGSISDHRIVELLPFLRPVECRQESKERTLRRFVLNCEKIVRLLN